MVLAAAAVLVFVAGAGVMFFQRFADHFPASFLRDAFLGGRALYQNTRDALGLDEPHEGHLYGPARHAGTGVVRHDPARAREGLTLFTSGHAPVALLIAMDGSLVHDMYLFEVKKPDESKGEWDLYKQISTIPGAQAFKRPKGNECPAVKG